MSDNLKRLGNDKLRLEKRINELEKNRGHEDTGKGVTINAGKDLTAVQNAVVGESRINPKLSSPYPLYELVENEKVME